MTGSFYVPQLRHGGGMDTENKTSAQEAEAAFSRGISHVTIKQRCGHTTLVDDQKAHKQLQSLIQNHMTSERCESVHEQRTALYKSDQLIKSVYSKWADVQTV